MAAILVVDDDIEMAALLKQLLELEGYDVRIANSGEEGMHQLQRGLPEAVLLDLEMPGLDGAGMAYRMFLHDLGMEHVPIVVSSGTVRAPEIAREIGTPYLLTKPYRYEALTRMVQRAITERIAPVPGTEGPSLCAPNPRKAE